MLLRTFALIAISVSGVALPQSADPTRAAERAAVASPDYPLAGFWKAHDCTAAWGLAISPTGKPQTYSVSFCGPGGCFKPGTYRPDTTLWNDEKYWVIDLNTIEVGGCGKFAGQFTRHVRCPGREP